MKGHDLYPGFTNLDSLFPLLRPQVAWNKCPELGERPLNRHMTASDLGGHLPSGWRGPQLVSKVEPSPHDLDHVTSATCERGCQPDPDGRLRLVGHLGLEQQFECDVRLRGLDALRRRGQRSSVAGEGVKSF